jgi:hypothetical protein
MRVPFVLLVLWLAPASAHAQVTVVAPGVPAQGGSGRASDANYGPARPAEIDSIVLSDGYQRAHVLIEGEVSPFENGQYWTIGHATARLLVIPGRQLDASELSRAGGRRVELRGVVRKLRPKEYLGPNRTDLDLVEDPTLPPLPPPNFEQGWPRISITVFEIRDRTTPEGIQKPQGGGMGRQILDEPSVFSGKTIRIFGQFRGRNLFADLPDGSARGKDAWVLKDGDTALWVIGKMPKGEGWKLDLDYKGDTKNWLEVEGKPEVLNGIVYLRASKVLMSRPPATERPEGPRR